MELLTKQEVSTIFRVNTRTIERWLKNRQLHGYKLGSGKTALWRIDMAEVKRFLDSNKDNQKMYDSKN